LTDAVGIPLAAEISGANVHDSKLLVKTVDGIVISGPRGPRRPENICLDKAYDGKPCESAIRSRRIRPHIRRRGEPPLLGVAKGKPRRWVVERTNSWHNNYRGLRTRWERKGDNYRALVHLACALLTYQRAIR
jgi:putative transposase